MSLKSGLIRNLLEGPDYDPKSLYYFYFFLQLAIWGAGLWVLFDIVLSGKYFNELFKQCSTSGCYSSRLAILAGVLAALTGLCAFLNIRWYKQLLPYSTDEYEYVERGRGYSGRVNPSGSVEISKDPDTYIEFQERRWVLIWTAFMFVVGAVIFIASVQWGTASLKNFQAKAGPLARALVLIILVLQPLLHLFSHRLAGRTAGKVLRLVFLPTALLFFLVYMFYTLYAAIMGKSLIGPDKFLEMLWPG